MSANDKSGSVTNTEGSERDLSRDDTTTTSPSKIDAAAQAMIGQQLKAMYSDFVHQEIPDDLLRLLDELASKEAKE